MGKYAPKRIIKVETIHVSGRRWFRRSHGGTSYCTAQIFVNGQLVHKTPRQYGYGDHYETIAAEWLERYGYIKRKHHENGSTDPLWSIAEDSGFRYSRDVADVSRKRDL